MEKNFTFIDTETTGLVIGQDRIIEIYFITENANGEVIEEYHEVFNPMIPIPEAASRKNGFTNEAVKDKATFGAKALQIYQKLKNSVLVGHNIWDFDLPMLMAEFRRCGVEVKEDFLVIDTQTVFRKRYSSALGNVYSIYTGKELANAHTGKADTFAMREVFKKQVELGHVGTDAQKFMETFLGATKKADPENKFKYNEKGELLVNFGAKWKGANVKDVDPGYFEWMLNAEFSPAVKDFIRNVVHNTRLYGK